MKTLSAVPGTWRVSKYASSISLFCTWYVLTDIFSPDCQLLEFRIHVSNVFRFQCIAWILWQGRPTSWLLKISCPLFSGQQLHLHFPALSAVRGGHMTKPSPRDTRRRRICGVFRWAQSINTKRNKTKQDKRLHGALLGDSWGSVQVPAAGSVDAPSDRTTLGVAAQRPLTLIREWLRQVLNPSLDC